MLLSGRPSIRRDEPASRRAPTARAGPASCCVALRLARSHRTCLASRATHPACASHAQLVPRAAPPAPRTVLPRAALTSLHWAVTSTGAHVATVCFVCFRCILHMFYLNFAKVDLVLHMLQWLYTYVSAISNIYCKCLSGCYIYCSGYTCMLCVCFKCFTCFRPMLQCFI
jgi:hypothetical protein